MLTLGHPNFYQAQLTIRKLEIITVPPRKVVVRTDRNNARKCLALYCAHSEYVVNDPDTI